MVDRANLGNKPYQIPLGWVFWDRTPEVNPLRWCSKCKEISSLSSGNCVVVRNMILHRTCTFCIKFLFHYSFSYDIQC